MLLGAKGRRGVHPLGGEGGPHSGWGAAVCSWADDLASGAGSEATDAMSGRGKGGERQ